MALADLLKRPDPATLRRRLAHDLMAATEHLEIARKSYGETEADLQEGVAAPAAAAKAEADLVAAKREVDRLTAALRTIDDRAQVSQVAAEREALAEAWDKAVKIAEARKKSAVEGVEIIKRFADWYLGMVETTGELYAALPKVPDVEAAFLRPEGFKTAVIRELFRLGIDMSSHRIFISSRPSIGEFIAPIEGAVSVVKEWQASALRRGE